MDLSRIELSLEGGAAPADSNELHGSRILVVDDEKSVLAIVEKALKGAGFRAVRTLNDSAEALAQLKASRPDLLVLDLHMPKPDGFEILETIDGDASLAGMVPVLVLTGNGSMDAMQRYLPGVARDVLLKPFDPREVVLRAENLVRTNMRLRVAEKDKAELHEKLTRTRRELQYAQVEAVQKLGAVADALGVGAAHHNRRVAELADLIAQSLGTPRNFSLVLRQAALLHDIAKAVHDAGNGVDHTIRGAKLIGEARSPFLRLAQEIALAHHEHWDGSGPPRGLRGEQIPLAARIVAVANAFDHSRNAEQGAVTKEAAFAAVAQHAGTRFDPAVVSALGGIIPDLEGDLGGSYIRRPDASW